MTALDKLKFNNSFARLPEEFFSLVDPQPLENAHLASLNEDVVKLLELEGIDFSDPAQLAAFSAQELLPDMQPIAQCYAGHQFGQFVPRLGDGRAIMLGELETKNNGKWDLQIKGSGPTPYSRGSDGRAVLRSTIREYLCGEAMHHLGIPSSRALCIIGSDEEIYREQIEPGAMLLRVAPSHVRFGSFEYFYHSNHHDHIKTLADHVIESHYPEFMNADDHYVKLLAEVIQRTARMLAGWQTVGFSHGVMNTDNMSILGLTIDYGPYGFMEAYDPTYVCNHSDHQGRYAFNQQPSIGLFNLSCLAQSLLPLFHDDGQQAANLARAELECYQPAYVEEYSQLMRSKLGFATQRDEDQGIMQELLELMAADKVDYTILFRKLSRFSTIEEQYNAPLRDMFIQREVFDSWAVKYTRRLKHEPATDTQRATAMNKVNPKYILRNYMAEAAIRKAEDEKDYSEIDRLLELLRKPFDEQPENEQYAGLPPDWAQSISVSCSS
ncbi:MAG: YdiU family protein [Sulfuriflexus sp.]|nr:YdiU family protein [Sulfuriflexus sp.]